MLLAGPTPWIAPLATGHPLGLPGAEKPNSTQQRVQPLAQSRDAEGALTRGRPTTVLWQPSGSEPDADTHVAPPSIMQIKILQMLSEQADKRAEDSPETESEDTKNSPDEAGLANSAGKPEEKTDVYLIRVGGGTDDAAENATRKEARTETSSQSAKTGYEEASSLSRDAVKAPAD
ncbi:hypothetical protein [Primorskyibacter sp. 2E233]|uniref:hypothetical protein n=1 Tax=Primorskyibacter sp. 2E233 TaxID=3413431 RepID=UPI003BF37330